MYSKVIQLYLYVQYKNINGNLDISGNQITDKNFHINNNRD